MTTLTNDGSPDDGVDGSTNSHDRNGIFGLNYDSTARNAANPGGNGVFGFTEVPNGAGVFGAHNTGGIGVVGLAQGPSGVGVLGAGNADDSGSAGSAGDGVQGSTVSPHRNGVIGRNNSTTSRSAADPGGNGVFGFTQVPDGAGVFGAHNTGGIGVAGLATGVSGNGVSGRSVPPDSDPRAPAGPGAGNGVFGFSTIKGSAGVFGANDYNSSRPESDGTLHGRGVQGNGPEVGVGGYSNLGTGVLGQSDAGAGIQGFTGSEGQNAIFGRNISLSPAPDGGPPAGNGIFGFTDVPNASGVVGAIGPNNTSGAGVTGIGNTGGASAGKFFGNVTVTGDIFLPGADCAEHFEIVCSESIEPGTVMVMNDDGALMPCRQAYDKKVADVISGAGGLRPGIILNKQEGEQSRLPLALIGKVNCRVDAESAPIQVGDLLTTSSVTGHAMKAEDPQRAFGAVIGKALCSLTAGKGFIPILVSLQ